MKTRIFILSIVFFHILLIKGQAYKPFPTDSASWGFYFTNNGSPIYTKEILKGDTLLGNKTYRKVSSQNSNLLGFYRENLKKVYAKILNYGDTSEILVYDFNLNVGDTFYDKRWYFNSAFKYKYVLTSITNSSLTIDVRKQYNFAVAGYQGPPNTYSSSVFANSCNNYWIEGIGSLKGIFNNRSPLVEGTECFYAAIISNATYATLRCFDHKQIQYMNQSCLTVNINEQNLVDKNFSVFPNPTSNQIQISVNNYSNSTKENWEYRITNTLDQVINSGFLNSPSNTIDLDNLPKGIYFLKLQSKYNQSFTQKIIKE